MGSGKSQGVNFLDCAPLLSKTADPNDQHAPRMLTLVLALAAITGPNPYRVLGVPRSSSRTDIRRAYHNRARQLHPDKNPGDADAQRRFIELQQAYETLSDERKRAQYDAGGGFGYSSGGSASQRQEREERRRTCAG